MLTDAANEYVRVEFMDLQEKWIWIDRYVLYKESKNLIGIQERKFFLLVIELESLIVNN